MNFAKMMRQAQDMQSKMQKMQEEIAAQIFEGSSGGGAVKAKANGEGTLLEITISKEVVAQGDAEMLQDLVLAAANGAIESGREYSKKKLGSLTAGLGIPGL